MVECLDSDKLRDFCAERSVHWLFTAPAAPHQKDCAEALVKSCKCVLKKAIGEQVLSPFELYTCLLEVLSAVFQMMMPNICVRTTCSFEEQHETNDTKNPRPRVEFVQKSVDSFWKRWSREVLPGVAPRNNNNNNNDNESLFDQKIKTHILCYNIN